MCILDPDFRFRLADPYFGTGRPDVIVGLVDPVVYRKNTCSY